MHNGRAQREIATSEGATCGIVCFGRITHQPQSTHVPIVRNLVPSGWAIQPYLRLAMINEGKFETFGFKGWLLGVLGAADLMMNFPAFMSDWPSPNFSTAFSHLSEMMGFP